MARSTASTDRMPAAAVDTANRVSMRLLPRFLLHLLVREYGYLLYIMAAPFMQKLLCKVNAGTG